MSLSRQARLLYNEVGESGAIYVGHHNVGHRLELLIRPKRLLRQILATLQQPAVLACNATTKWPRSGLLDRASPASERTDSSRPCSVVYGEANGSSCGGAAEVVVVVPSAAPSRPSSRSAALIFSVFSHVSSAASERDGARSFAAAAAAARRRARIFCSRSIAAAAPRSVSYTHLTLPTKA